MKQFWLFSGETFYPSGGMKDFVLSFDTVQEAVEYANATHPHFAMHWHHVADGDSGEIMWDWNDLENGDNK